MARRRFVCKNQAKPSRWFFGFVELLRCCHNLHSDPVSRQQSRSAHRTRATNRQYFSVAACADSETRGAGKRTHATKETHSLADRSPLRHYDSGLIKNFPRGSYAKPNTEKRESPLRRLLVNPNHRLRGEFQHRLGLQFFFWRLCVCTVAELRRIGFVCDFLCFACWGSVCIQNPTKRPNPSSDHFYSGSRLLKIRDLSSSAQLSILAATATGQLRSRNGSCSLGSHSNHRRQSLAIGSAGSRAHSSFYCRPAPAIAPVY